MLKNIVISSFIHKANLYFTARTRCSAA